MVDDTIVQFEGVLDRAPLDTRVATVRGLFERVDVDIRELKAVAVWNVTTDQGVNRSDAVSEWLRRAGAGHLLHSRGATTSEISLHRPACSREWLRVALGVRTVPSGCRAAVTCATVLRRVQRLPRKGKEPAGHGAASEAPA
ncbi:MAG TPA: hypothetical protein VGR23_03795 [Candidatus Dormibacteraeota bacterium]|jgi:hypothetical protein|nr:hypothetical protein [Candidatus Dormibacteraeota bacterium]